MDLDDINFNKLRIGEAPFIYQVRFLDFVFAKTFSAEDYELEKYLLPAEAAHISIAYQARESDAVLGPTLVLNSWLSR
ncbi:MAG: hypothetical protein R3F37_07920 [Candidatus Competibacteraceae bacterium]